LKYERYKEQTIQDIFSGDQLKGAVELKAFFFESSVFLNNKNGTFTRKVLPAQAQLSPVYAMSCNDYDGDGKKDLLLGGNYYAAKPEVGRYDASYGLFLKGDGAGNFSATPSLNSGINVKGEVRNIVEVTTRNRARNFIFLLNDAAPVIYQNKNRLP
jgi:hypothetical protein